MLRLVSLFSLFLLSMILAGCGPIYKTEYAYVPPRSNMGQMCVSQCVQNKGMCEQMCQMRNENCRMQARQDAQYQYDDYKHQMKRKHKKIEKDFRDFDRSYTCNNSCDCTSAFHTCYSACGGQVLERQVCVAFCDKK